MIETFEKLDLAALILAEADKNKIKIGDLENSHLEMYERIAVDKSLGLNIFDPRPDYSDPEVLAATHKNIFGL